MLKNPASVSPSATAQKTQSQSNLAAPQSQPFQNECKNELHRKTDPVADNDKKWQNSGGSDVDPDGGTNSPASDEPVEDSLGLD